MSSLGVVMGALLVLVVLALVLVPYWRAGTERTPVVDDNRDLAGDVDRILHRDYCLDCGAKLERPGQSPCPHCGAAGSDAS